MAYIPERPLEIYEPPNPNGMPLWQVPFAAAGAIVDCITCQGPRRDFEVEQQFRLRNALRMYPGPEIHNKAVFTTIPLRDEAVRRGLIQVPSNQMYTETYRSPLGVPQQLVPVQAAPRDVPPMPVYSSPPQVFVRQVMPTTVTRVYDGAPLYRASQPVLTNPPSDPVVGSFVSSWAPYAWKEPLVSCSTAHTVESVSKAVQVSPGKADFGEAIVKDSVTSGHDAGAFEQLESTNHTVSGEEEKSDPTVSKEGITKATSLSVGSTDSVEVAGDGDDREKASEQLRKKAQSSGEGFKSGKPVDETAAAGGQLQTTTTASEALSTPRVTKEQAVHAVVSSGRGVKAGAHPVGFVPPEDPRDYKELRIGDSVYLMGGTFYLSDTGAYLLGLRN
ncbi:hypothetical protein CSUI_005190 [Cystoisospora suis]|uniref:Uncharacterized protein n=1 Tax=Cystoisospora suis TaxID=483139 RepID=A0A2C6KW30_9APIC|nr:hypothetical protein CSUI_005190 [Cystoisospora suis]